MDARTVSELANWDGRLGKKQQNSQWRRASTSLAHDPYRKPVESKPMEISKTPNKPQDRRRAEHSASRSNFERGSLANPPASVRLSSRVDTTSSVSHKMHHSRRTSITHTTPNSALRSSPMIASSKSSHLAPNSFAHPSRHRHPRLTSRVPSRPASTIQPEVIDLTLDYDTEDELPLSVLTANSRKLDVDPGPSRQTLSSPRSSPVDQEQSLFTPPPSSKRRSRLVIDYLAVPPFPKGLTKADYRPMFDHSVGPLPGPTLATTLGDSSLAGPSATKWHDPQKREGKERELDMASCKKHKHGCPPHGIDMDPSQLLDAFYEPTIIPIYDDDTYPPLTTLDLVTNTRFQFMHAWRGQASKLREAELDWMSNLRLPGKACILAQSAKPSLPRMPGTAGFVSSDKLLPWELALPESSPEEKSTKHVLEEQAHAAVTHGVSPEDVLPGPSTAFSPAPSSSTAARGLAVVDIEHDMQQYLNGLGDSPAKHASPRQQLAPTHTFRLQHSQPPKHAQTNSLELEFSSLELDPRLADTGDLECFLGVPPSPPPADLESSTVAGPIPDSPFEPTSYFPASPINIPGASHTDSWSFEQEDGLLQDNGSPPNNHVLPTAPGTIDPSLLGLEESRKPSRAPEKSIPKRRSKLPDPVIYIRRPVDSSSLPLLSGKRQVQIKYRDSGGSPASLSTQTGSTETPSDPVASAVVQSSNDKEGSPRLRRRSIPSRKLREYHTESESESDYLPAASALKIKRPSLRDTESLVERGSVGAETVPTMTFCHQCRNTSARPKMLCSNVVQGRVCGKRFCNRCILYRYPDVTFDEHSPGFLCPVCTNTCNCSACSRKRGEEFISMRLGGLAASLLKAKVTFVRDISKSLHRDPSPSRGMDTRRSASEATTSTPGPGALPMQSQFWAHVYGMEGERVGSAFMTREHMENLQAGRAPPPPSLPKQPQRKARRSTKRGKEREKTRGPRVFIGRPLPSWKVRAVRDLEPSVVVEGRGKGKDKETGTGTGSRTGTGTVSDGRRRCYIGNPASLHEPYGRMPGPASPTPSSSRCSTPPLDSSNGNLTPLSELEPGDWPQPDVGEFCSWAPPPPPGIVVHPLSSDSSGISTPFAMEPPDLGSLDMVGTWPNAEGLQGRGPGPSLVLSSSSGMDMNIDVGDEQLSASTALSLEDMARAISVALAALGVEPPPG